MEEIRRRLQTSTSLLTVFAVAMQGGTLDESANERAPTFFGSRQSCIVIEEEKWLYSTIYHLTAHLQHLVGHDGTTIGIHMVHGSKDRFKTRVLTWR